MKNTNHSNDTNFIFKRKEAYALAVIIVFAALVLEVWILVADSSGGSTGKLLVALPVCAFLVIKLIFKNSEQSK